MWTIFTSTFKQIWKNKFYYVRNLLIFVVCACMQVCTHVYKHMCVCVFLFWREGFQLNLSFVPVKRSCAQLICFPTTMFSIQTEYKKGFVSWTCWRTSVTSTFVLPWLLCLPTKRATVLVSQCVCVWVCVCERERGGETVGESKYMFFAWLLTFLI